MIFLFLFIYFDNDFTEYLIDLKFYHFILFIDYSNINVRINRHL